MSGLDQALRNVGDGLSTLDIADGGLDSIAQNLNRMRELAVQAASETITDRERAYLQTEIDALRVDIDATAQSSRLNKTGVLAHDGIDVGLVLDTSGSMGGELNALKNAINNFQATFDAASLDVRIGVAAYKAGVDFVDGTEQLLDIGEDGLSATLNGITLTGSPVDPWAALLNTSGAQDVVGTAEQDQFSFRPYARDKLLIVVSDAGREADLVPGAENETAIAAMLAARGIQVHAIVPPGANWVFDEITAATGGQMWNLGSAGSGIAPALNSIATTLSATLGTSDLHVQAGDGSSSANRIAIPHPIDATASGLGLDGLSVATATDAQGALSTLDAALDSVNHARARSGGSRNRLQSARSLNETTRQALAEAASRIEDADIAAASANVMRTALLEQASLAAQAKANALASRYVDALLPGGPRGSTEVIM